MRLDRWWLAQSTRRVTSESIGKPVRESNSMQQFVEAVEDLISDHWIKVLTALGFTLFGWVVAHWRASRAWSKREFFDRINFSLDSIADDTLRIRTLCKKKCADIFLNEHAVNRLGKLIVQTTPADPVVPIFRRMIIGTS